MPSVIEIILIILATWRIVSFLQDEKGPFDVMLRIRKVFKIVHDEQGNPVGWPENFIGQLFSCFWCLSFWVGIVVYLLYLVSPIIPLIFAISAGAILLCEVIERLRNGNRNL